MFHNMRDFRSFRYVLDFLGKEFLVASLCCSNVEDERNLSIDSVSVQPLSEKGKFFDEIAIISVFSSIWS